jgi:hypothetical protein
LTRSARVTDRIAELEQSIMAHPSKKALSYIEKAEKMGWDDLIELWGQIKDGNTPGWTLARHLSISSCAPSNCPIP